MTRHFLVIGGQRCGTTYLHSLLEQHPDIAMARPARPEPKVFCSDELTDQGAGWYDATYFSHASPGQLLGEKSTSYLEDHEAPGRAAKMLGDVQIVVQLREPVERAVSNWRFSTDNGRESRSLEEALRENLAGAREWDAAGSSVSPFAYLERGRYVDHLRPWTDTFPRVHVLFLSEVLTQDDALAQLYADLGVDPGFRPARRDPVNQSETEAPTMSAELRALLGEYFAASNAQLSRLLRRELPW